MSVADLTEDPTRVWCLLRRALKQAVSELVRTREQEGRALAKDIRRRLRNMRRIHSAIARCAPRVAARFAETLRKRVSKAGIDVASDDPMLLREVVFFAERSDISEELVRLESHFEQVETRIGSKEPVGRALDFLCQEMFREINTIGSKAADAEISRSVVDFKSELECAREQVQNVE